MAEEHRAWASELSELEYERLKSFEYSGRLNEILIEGFDFWTDLGLIAVLFVFSSENVDVQYEDPIIGVLTATTFTQCQTGDAAPDRDRSLFRALFVAALVLQVVNVIVRACIAVGKLCYKETIDGIKKAALYIAGVIFVIVSPHNGLFFIDTVFQRSTDAEGVIEFTQREILLDVLLIGLEDLPQFVVSQSQLRALLLRFPF